MPKSLIVDYDIHRLNLREEGKLLDSELLPVLRRRNTRIGLYEIGKIANHLFWEANKDVKSRSVLFSDSTIIFTQWSLAYLASALIRCGGNDYSKLSFFQQKYGKPLDNLIALNNVHCNTLVQPELAPGYGEPTYEKLNSTMLRIAFEQFPYQFDPVAEMARSIYLFNELSTQIQDVEIPSLHDVFLNVTGLTLADYLDISFAITVLTHEKPVFSLPVLSETPVTTLQRSLSSSNLKKYITLMAHDYKSFRSVDEKMNSELAPEYTRYRFNPLVSRPIVLSQKENLHIVPSASLLIRAAFPGLFWLFDTHFRSQGKKRGDAFRAHFAKIYELYIGNILKDIFGDRVRSGDIEENYQFFDWYFDEGDTSYLFEVKAYQYPLSVQMMANEDETNAIVERNLKKIIDQTGRKLKDIRTRSFLKSFSNKKLYPIAIIWNMPLISSRQFEEKIKRMIEETRVQYSLDALNIHFMENHELENLASVDEVISLVNIIEEADRSPSESIGSVIRKHYKVERNPTLQKIFNDFTNRISPAIADKSLR